MICINEFPPYELCTLDITSDLKTTSWIQFTIKMAWINSGQCIDQLTEHLKTPAHNYVQSKHDNILGKDF